MKTSITIIFYSNFETHQALLERARCGPDVIEMDDPSPRTGRRQIVVTLDNDDDRASILIRELEQHQLDMGIKRWDFFTDDELAQARLLYVWSLPASEIGGDIGLGTTFNDWTASVDTSGTCPGCYANARQTAPYMIDDDEEDLAKLEGRRLVASYWGHFLVDDRLADELVAAGVTGLSFHNVYALSDKKRQIKLRWKQIAAQHQLPPVAPQTTGLYQERPCKICNRSGYCTLQENPLRLAYRASDLAGMLDFNNTWEGFGFATIQENKMPSKLSVPGLLITPKVWKIFRNAGVTDVDYLPIRVVEA